MQKLSATPYRKGQVLHSVFAAALDYYSVFGMDEPTPLQIDALNDDLLMDPEKLIGTYERPGISSVKEDVLRSFPAL